MKTWEVNVLIKNGNAKIPHTVHIIAQNSFAAKQQASAQYGSSNVVSIPVEVRTGSNYDPAPWMKNF